MGKGQRWGVAIRIRHDILAAQALDGPALRLGHELRIDAIELSQFLVNEGVIRIEEALDRTVGIEQLAEKQSSLCPHRRLQIVVVVYRKFTHIRRHGPQLAQGQPAVEELVHEGS